MNNAVPARAKITAIVILRNTEAPANQTVAMTSPRLAASTVPAVVGATNRLRTRLCMISPTTPMAEPESRIAASRGTLLTTNSNILDDSARRRSEMPMSLTPMNRDQADTAVRDGQGQAQESGIPKAPCRRPRASMRRHRHALLQTRLNVFDNLEKGGKGGPCDVPVERVHIDYPSVLPRRRLRHQLVVQDLR